MDLLSHLLAADFITHNKAYDLGDSNQGHPKFKFIQMTIELRESSYHSRKEPEEEVGVTLGVANRQVSGVAVDWILEP